MQGDCENIADREDCKSERLKLRASLLIFDFIFSSLIPYERIKFLEW